jgi:hypothetical protein
VAARFAELVPRADKALADDARAQLIATVRTAKKPHDLAYGYGILDPGHP